MDIKYDVPAPPDGAIERTINLGQKKMRSTHCAKMPLGRLLGLQLAVVHYSHLLPCMVIALPSRLGLDQFCVGYSLQFGFALDKVIARCGRLCRLVFHVLMCGFLK